MDRPTHRGVATFAVAVASYCGQTLGSITSWGRTEARNALVGGHPNSHHLRFMAVDVVYDRPISERTRQALASDLGLKIVPEGDHDHIQSL